MGWSPSWKRSKFLSICLIIDNAQLDCLSKFVEKDLKSFFILFKKLSLSLLSSFFDLLLGKCTIFVFFFVLFKLVFIDEVPLGDFRNHIKNFLGDFLVDDLECLRLLKSFSVHIEGQIIRVNHTLNETQILGDNVAVLLCNQHSPHVQFQIILTSVVVRVKIIRGSVGNIEDRCENNLSLSVKMDPIQWRIRLLWQTLVKLNVIIFIKIFFISQPNGFISIYLFPLFGLLFDFLLLLIFSFFSDLDFIIRLVFSILRFSIDFDFNSLFKIDREVDEFWILSDKIFELSFIQELLGIFFEIDLDLCTSAQRFTFILFDCVGGSGFRGPLVLVILVGLWSDFDLVASQEGGVETNTKLAD